MINTLLFLQTVATDTEIMKLWINKVPQRKFIYCFLSRFYKKILKFQESPVIPYRSNSNNFQQWDHSNSYHGNDCFYCRRKHTFSNCIFNHKQTRIIKPVQFKKISIYSFIIKCKLQNILFLYISLPPLPLTSFLFNKPLSRPHINEWIIYP